MYGRAFRNPSTYERFWQPNPAVEAERIDTFELAREQSLGRRANLITTVFHYRLGGPITGVPLRDDTLQYRNASKANATGVEVEAGGNAVSWLETSGSYSIQRTRGGDASQALENSPAQAWNLRALARVAQQRLLLSAAVRHLGSRMGAAGSRAPAATLADVTLTAPHLAGPLTVQLGIRNLANKTYLDPLSPEHATEMLSGPGRSVFIRLTWQYE
jgi:outer membrane receptor protein involved in Fe transport